MQNQTSSTAPIASPPQDYTPQLQALMAKAGLSSLRALYKAGLSKPQVQRLRRGEITQLKLQTLLSLCQALNISLPQLVEIFGLEAFSLETFGLETPSNKTLTSPSTPNATPENHLANQLVQLQQEYHRLQAQLQQQRAAIQQELQQQSLQILEPFLLQWPTAAYAARNNPSAPAVKLLPLARPIDQLLQTWGITPIGEVGSNVAYDPQLHDVLNGGSLPAGTLVRVRTVGYYQGERLLYRAKVSVDA
jgi:DNA-binding Xre family transcriptional regulator/molecular chaperone GrpE (heat shock protein)